MIRNTRHWLAIFFGLLATAAAPALSAETLNRSARMEAALASASLSAPQPDEAMQVARLRLDASLLQLKQFLAQGGSTKELGWRQWLDLPGLESALAQQRPEPGDLEIYLERFSQDRQGLELPAFTSVRSDLRRYLDACEYGISNSPQQFYQQRLDQLDGCLKRLDQSPTAEDAAQAGQLIAWFDALGGDAANLAASARTHFCSTNGQLTGSARLINFLLERGVADQRTIADMVLGAFTQGTVFSRAQVSFGFLPSSEHATLEVRMHGRADAPANIAERRRVAVYSSAITAIQASKPVYLNDKGLQFAPANAASSTQLQLNDVEARRRFVERMAWRRAGRMVPAAEDVASQRASAEASTQLNQQTRTALSGVNNLFQNSIRAPLIRHDALPAEWRFSTDREHLRMSLTQCNDSQLAVATPLPQLSTSHDVAFIAHESLITNLTESMLGGATIMDCVWMNVVKQLTGEAPRPLWVHDRSERWSVTLAPQLPLLPEFDDNRLAFTLRLVRVTRGDTQFDHPVEIEARFKLLTTRDGPALEREAPVQIRFTEPLNQDTHQSLEKFLRQKFEAVFPPQFYFYGLQPPEGGMLGKLNQLRLAQFESTAGWLIVGYELKAQSSDILASRPNSPSLPAR